MISLPQKCMQHRKNAAVVFVAMMCLFGRFKFVSDVQYKTSINCF